MESRSTPRKSCPSTICLPKSHADWPLVEVGRLNQAVRKQSPLIQAIDKRILCQVDAGCHNCIFEIFLQALHSAATIRGHFQRLDFITLFSHQTRLAKSHLVFPLTSALLLLPPPFIYVQNRRLNAVNPVNFEAKARESWSVLTVRPRCSAVPLSRADRPELSRRRKRVSRCAHPRPQVCVP